MIFDAKQAQDTELTLAPYTRKKQDENKNIF